MVFLCPFLGMACLWDYSVRRVPNMIPAIIFGLGMIYRYCMSDWRGLLGYLINLIVVTLIMFPLFSLGMMGGGDVKLIAVSSGFFSGKDTAVFVIMIFVLSAVPALIRIIRTRSIGRRFAYFGRYLKNSLLRKDAEMYIGEKTERHRAGIAMSGPILISAVLHWGGVY